MKGSNNTTMNSLVEFYLGIFITMYDTFIN